MIYHRPRTCSSAFGVRREGALHASAVPQSPLGLFDTDSLIGEEDRAMRDTVRRFVDERIKPEIGDWYESGFDSRQRAGQGADRTELRLQPSRDAHPRRSHGTDWVLNGNKMWSTNGSFGDQVGPGHRLEMRRARRRPLVLIRPATANSRNLSSCGSRTGQGQLVSSLLLGERTHPACWSS
jgi:hypothetical protein